jgi:hypothetical protein
MRLFWRLGLAGAFALGALALELAGAADRGGALAGALFRRFLVMTAQLHLAVDALALQLLLERAQRLLDIVVANDDLLKSPSQSLLGNRIAASEASLGGARALAGVQRRFNPPPRH